MESSVTWLSCSNSLADGHFNVRVLWVCVLAEQFGGWSECLAASDVHTRLIGLPTPAGIMLVSWALVCELWANEFVQANESCIG